ncbi:MAG TPA: PfkB family carbohydrate kinase [Hyphomicrobiaceae bacterium]|jgi:sulfofructose kinase|nr:PfkB family carbohydrate kinase [Hyphomicrobiaceae bacterium]
MAAARRIICVGHAALDRIYRIEAFPPEPSKVRALEHIEAGGGMAANAAVAIARLGGKAELWSRTGDDAAGATVRAGLKAERVDVRYLQAFEGARTSTSAIIVDRHGERLIVGQRDAGMPSGTSWLPLERVREADAVLGDLRWLEALRSVFARARQEGVPTVLDADLGAREALESILRLTDYAVFSAPALRELVPAGSDAERLESVLGFGARYAGVTLGADGYLWRDQEGTRRLPAFGVAVADTTGAGDAFHGALALLLAEGRPMHECARSASAVAAMKCTRLGSRSGLPTRAELTAFLATHAA